MRIEEKNGNLVVTDFNDLEAFKIARAVEKDGIEFYAKLVTRVPEGEPKNVLAFLIGEEKKHLRLFEGLMFKLSEGKQDPFEEDDLLGSMDFGIFRPYKDINELENILESPKKALRLGLIIEDKSIRFYELCKMRVSGADTKKVLDEIIQEEWKHKQLLENIQGKV